MTFKMLTTITAVGAALMLGVPTAWGGDEPLRDHGDAAQAKLDAQSSTQPLVIVRDHGDATQAKLAQESLPPVIVRYQRDTSQPTQSPSVAIVRDHGDASQAKIEAQTSTPALVIVRDHGDATQAKLAAQSAASVTTERTRQSQDVASRVEVASVDSGREIEWPQVGAGLGIGLLLALGLGLAMRAFNVRPFAHR